MTLGARRTSTAAGSHLDFRHPYVRSERSPLHDVRQHAYAHDPCGTHHMCEFIFTDELLSGAKSLYVALSRQDHRWWSQTGSNRRPPACKAGALPTELWPRTAVPSKGGNGGPGKI